MKFNPLSVMAIISVALILAMLLFILSSVLSSLLGGMVVAYLFYPVVERYGTTKLRRKVVSSLVVIFVVVPSLLILLNSVYAALSEAHAILKFIAKRTLYMEEQMGLIEETFRSLGVEVDVSALISNLLNKLLEQVDVTAYALLVIKSLPNLIIQLFIFSVSSYFLLRDGGEVAKWFLELLPSDLSPIVLDFLGELDKILKGIFYGYVFASLVVSAISVPFYRAFGFRHPLFLAVLTFLFGVLPILGTPLVYGPLAVIKFLENPWEGILMGALGTVLLVLLPMLVITPFFAEREASVHPLLVLIAFIAGPITCGPMGLVIGPIVVGLSLALLKTMKKRKLLF